MNICNILVYIGGGPQFGNPNYWLKPREVSIRRGWVLRKLKAIIDAYAFSELLADAYQW